MVKPILTRRVGFTCSSAAEKSAVGNRESLAFSTYETRLQCVNLNRFRDGHDLSNSEKSFTCFINCSAIGEDFHASGLAR